MFRRTASPPCQWRFLTLLSFLLAGHDAFGQAAPSQNGHPVIALHSASVATTRSPRLPVIREPAQGRPVFIKPGETFYLVLNLPPGFKGDVSFYLRHAREPSLALPLRSTTPPAYFSDDYCHLVVQVPSGATPGLYDVELRAAGESHYSRRCVRIIDTFKTRFRFVHLSSMNVGELTAPDFDYMLPAEVNLLGPEFIVATGDYTEWARALDDAASWTRVLAYFEQFDAPVYMVCGVHDHQNSFTTYVANSPLGTIDYGDYHGLLLLDHSAHPIDQDPAQIQWIEADLQRNRDRRINFIVSNSDELGLLDVWRERGPVAEFLSENRIRLFIAGGATDWDFREFSHKLRGLRDVHYVRTHQASTSLRDRATGFSHFRAIEVDGDRLSYVYPNDSAAERLQHSIPTGRLRAIFDAPNDGTAEKLTVTVQNALNQSFAEARLWMRVAKRGDAPPQIAGGRLLRVIDGGAHWGCEIGFDLPDKGAVRIMIATDAGALPKAPPFELALEAPREWVFAQKVTDFGLRYFESDARAVLRITNGGRADQTCWPVVRLNGSELHADFAAVPRKPMTLGPGKSVELPLILSLRKVSPGLHQLQVYFLEDPLSRLTTFDVSLTLRQDALTNAGEPAAD